jgi:hypothetical protein
MSTLSLSRIVQRRADLLASDMQGETVMLDMVSGYYFAMDSVGGRIWQLLEHASTVAQVCQSLQQEYEVDEATCQREVSEFIDELLKHHLVTITADSQKGAAA